MLGWMMVFALMAILAGVMDIVAAPTVLSISTKLAMVLFGTLFLVCLVSSVARNRA